MKYLLSTLLVLAVAAVAAGFACFHFSSSPELHDAACKGDAMAWLRTDFALDERQSAEIKRLHEAYAVTCAEHCRLIQAADETRAALKKSPDANPAALAAADHALQELRATCESAITAHVQQVAAVMSPADGKRYLALVLPKITDFDHHMSPDLALAREHKH